MALHNRGLSATFMPGGFDDDYYQPQAPELLAPEPQRINPELSNQIQGGLQNMNLNAAAQTHNYSDLPIPAAHEVPHLSPFPKLANPPPNVPPSDEELEATLENARQMVLTSNNPEMQLIWAADSLVYVGVCTDNEERIAASKPYAARPATPRIEHQLRTDAMNIVTFLSDQHHPKAEFLRGMWLEWGRFGQREDKREAFRCYSRAADRGYARAEYRIGMLYESYNDPIKALRHYHRGVDAGDAASCYRLGMMTLRGQHGQPKDFGKGIELIRKSADAADENAAQGAYVYGSLLARELPQIEVPDALLPYDERGARINIEKAAYLKFAKAQLKMGSLYELGGLGCEFNAAFSMHYFALASKQGEAEADMGLSKWFLVGREGLFPKNEALAYTYAERAAQSGLATAEFAMGYFYEIGMHVPVDLDQAMDWYQKASKHGNEDARGRVEGLSKKQVLSRKDHENVAITRIKSQYGSKRGARPERFQQRQGPSRLGQSSIAEEMAGGGGGYGSGYGNGIGTPPPASGMRLSSTSSVPQVPPRGDSVTPYPMDNRPPTVGPISRPGSAAPYPLEDGPPPQLQQKATPRLGPAGGYFNSSQPPRPATTLNPDMRPSSAFQLNPEVRSSSAVSVPQLPSQGGRGPGYQQGGSGYPLPGTRPMTTQPQPYGPGGPGMQRPGANRIASGPPGTQGLQQQGQGGFRPGMPPPQQSAPGGGKLNIGFSAPPESRGQRYGPGPQPGAGAVQPPVSPGLGKSGSMPNFDQPAPQGQGGRTSAPPSRPASRPGDGRRPMPPLKDGPPVPGQSETPRPPLNTTHTSGTPTNQPPAKGPKTFDEMGVPAQSQDGNCCVM